MLTVKSAFYAFIFLFSKHKFVLSTERLSKEGLDEKQMRFDAQQIMLNAVKTLWTLSPLEVEFEVNCLKKRLNANLCLSFPQQTGVTLIWVLLVIV